MDQETFVEIAREYSKIALFRELSADHLTPVQAYIALQGNCLLESDEESAGRHSFIGADPIETISDPKEGFEALRAGQRKVYARHPLGLYTGGLIGFVSYDAVRKIESIPSRHVDQKKIPDLYFNMYRSSAVFDHRSGKMLLGHLVEVGESPIEDYLRGTFELEKLEQKLFSPVHLPMLQLGERAEVFEEIGDATFEEMVLKAKEHIRAGDVFQLVSSRTFRTSCNDAFALYRRLRQEAPAPYLFYFDVGDRQIVGASPEKLISVQGRVIESTPIAGTRPSGGDPAELLADSKERAEHLMLVDLARNDLGAVSEIGSVVVKDLMQVRRFPRVMHIVSTVTGILKEGLDAIDAFKASFPAGTLTGAPKIRAMELIDEIEPSRRGLYGGAIVAIDARGNLDSCIAIRMGLVENGELTVRAGAGIVYDSDPAKEAEETRLKASSILRGVS